ncbi:sensor histidine kinase [Inhella proteolytica]|uniref:histidine kinase n=1 Tax=Inhella proteolytica TaxID=2795029 RepID=A0A931J430_9BURK|nr:ATP-binding protein [Inhella proteolytica]MBH9577393.1 histidine kinase [Inhella proteolytica]
MRSAPSVWASVRRVGAFLFLLLNAWLAGAAPLVLEQARLLGGQGAPVQLPRAPGPVAQDLQFRFDYRGGERVAAALWLASPCGVRSVRVNGVVLLEDGAGLPCRGPLLLALPIGLLGEQGNLLELRQQSLDPTPFSLGRAERLDAPQIGPWDELLGLHRSLVWQRAGLALGAAGVLAGLALALGLMGLMHRWERRLLLGATALLAWALLLVAEWQVWLPRDHADLLRGLLLGLCCAGWLLLLGRQLGWRHTRLDAAALLLAVTLPWLPWSLGQAPAAATLQGAVLGLWAAALALVSLGFMVHRLRQWRHAGEGLRAWREQAHGTLLPVLTSLGLLACLLAWAQTHRSPAVPWVTLGLALAGLSQLLGFAQARLQAEQRLVTNDQRWQERLVEFERQQRTLSDQHLEQVTERERKRIAADLHDDLGAKLLTIVHTSESERISTLAREALEEMRLSVRGLTGKPVQLLDAVGDWRAEVVSRLTQANIEAEWISLAEDVSYTLPARAYVQTTRIIRESISNIIKHSGATRCTVRCQVLDDDFQVILQDNGHGISSALDGRLDKGHGMASMKARAKQMQGQCLVESGPGWGTLIRLSIPL